MIPVSTICQMPSPFAIAIAGVAGSGKTTLGRALAARLSCPIVDLDTVTNPLLDRLQGVLFDDHWLSSPHASVIRDARYEALAAVAHDAIDTTGGAVMAAPFTAELAGTDAWAALVERIAPAELVFVQVVGDPALFEERRAVRGAERDAHRPRDVEPEVGIPVIRLDADLSTQQQLARVLPRLGRRSVIDATAPIFDAEFDAVLFDLDGSLVDSTASVIRSWRRLAGEYGFPMAALHANHGQPATALVSRLIPPDRRDEALARITRLEVEDAVGLEPVLGAREVFASIPEERRAIVTSGSVPIATARLTAASLAVPAVFVTVEDISRGKPDPEPFLTAAARLGVRPERCLVIEDAVAGVASGRAAGCRVLAVTGTVGADELADADLVVDGLDRIAVVDDGRALRIRAS